MGSVAGRDILREPKQRLHSCSRGNDRLVLPCDSSLSHLESSQMGNGLDCTTRTFVYGFVDAIPRALFDVEDHAYCQAGQRFQAGLRSGEEIFYNSGPGWELELLTPNALLMPSHELETI